MTNVIRLVPENRFYRIKLIPMVEKIVKFHLRKAGRMNEFDDACADVLLKMIPMLREYQPSKSDEASNYNAFLRTCITYRLYAFMVSQHKGNWSGKEKKTLFDFVSFEALPEYLRIKEALDEPPDLRKDKYFNKYEDYEYHKFLWDNLLPKLIGHYRTRLLFYQYVWHFTHLQIALRYGQGDINWSNKLNRESITMLKMKADEDPKIREEFLR